MLTWLYLRFRYEETSTTLITTFIFEIKAILSGFLELFFFPFSLKLQSQH